MDALIGLGGMLVLLQRRYRSLARRDRELRVLAGQRVLGAIVICICLVPSLALAAAMPSLPKDGSVEERLRSLSAELRCVVCQNQSLGESSAPLAVDLKRQPACAGKAASVEAAMRHSSALRGRDVAIRWPPSRLPSRSSRGERLSARARGR